MARSVRPIAERIAILNAARNRALDIAEYGSPDESGAAIVRAHRIKLRIDKLQHFVVAEKKEHAK